MRGARGQERGHRTSVCGGGRQARCDDSVGYTSSTERTLALADFLHTYNHHRCHTALGGQPPISRVNNAAGQYT
ncbi:integrase core domain-containing protein [Streptomyces sp. NPDC093064]|uniref:integrase core domain-containing protein n=1 Tax=unclassified Streptomyces TaxID=2593676 RepID=UPI0035E0006E